MKNKTSYDSIVERSIGRLTSSSIKRKLILIIIFIGTIAVTLSGTTIIAYQYLSFKSQMIEDITAHAAVIGINSQAALDFDDAEDAKIVLSSLQGVPSVVYASLMDEYGEFFASYQRDEGDFSAQLPPVNNQALYSDNWLLISQDIFLADDQLIGRVFIQSDTSELNSLIVQSTVAVVAIGIFALLISYFLASKLQAVISTPILELTLNCWKLWAIE